VKKLFFCLVCVTLTFASLASQECAKTEFTTEQQKYFDAALQKYAACPLPLDGSCRAALAQALEHLYGVKDFGSEAKYMAPAEIGKKVFADSNWSHLGSASDQNALKSAQSSANCGKAVIAVLASESGGHVAIILPGALSHSGGWKLDVPNAASFFTHNPGKSFAGKPLSYSFPNAQGIELYARK